LECNLESKRTKSRILYNAVNWQVEKECSWCFSIYIQKTPTGKYCSKDCSNKSNRHAHRYGWVNYSILPLCKCGRIATPPKRNRDNPRRIGRATRCDICRQLKEQERNKGRGSSKSLLRRQVVKKGEKIKIDNLVIRDGFDCQICGVVLDWSKRGSRKLWPSLDHIVPITKGGEHTYENCRMVHLGCNASKGNK
jgi:5-methylcytosine-specific restriction endonuclease McrA